MKRVAVFLTVGSLFAQSQSRLTDQRIVEMVNMGVSEGEILRVIQTAQHFDFDLRPPSTDAMLQAGVSEDIMKAMAAREASNSTAYQSQAQTPAANRPLTLPARTPSSNGTVSSSASGIAVSPITSSPARFDQPPKPVYSPLPDFAGDAVPVAISVQPVTNGVADAYSLSDGQVQQLIGNGKSAGNQLGFALTVSPIGPFGAISCTTCEQSGSSIRIYTREEWIELAARNAKRENQTFSVADVSSAARMPLLYVSLLSSFSAGSTSSVPHISLHEISGRGAIQPLDLPNGALEASSAFRLASAGTITAAFQVSDLNALRASDPKGEIFIAVASEGGSKYFKVTAESLRTLLSPNAPLTVGSALPVPVAR